MYPKNDFTTIYFSIIYQKILPLLINYVLKNTYNNIFPVDLSSSTMSSVHKPLKRKAIHRQRPRPTNIICNKNLLFIRENKMLVVSQERNNWHVITWIRFKNYKIHITLLTCLHPRLVVEWTRFHSIAISSQDCKNWNESFSSINKLNQILGNW